VSRPLPLAVLLLAAGAALACGGGGSPAATARSRPAVASSDWWNGAVVYEVFVRSFRDSGADGNGDLEGLIEKLDYLRCPDPPGSCDPGKALGVDALWLMPIYPSPSYHGYDVTDLRGVNPDYGSLSDLDLLLAAAHARGLRVVLDFVPNHTSIDHPWFEDSESPSSEKRDYYVWSEGQESWPEPWGGGDTWYKNPQGSGYYYAVFSSGMPDLNWKNPAVAAEIEASALYWLSRGVDGFRLDAVRYLVENGRGEQEDEPGTHAALRHLAATLREARSDALIVGEAWADTPTIATYHGTPTTLAPFGDELPLTFDFPLASAIVSGILSGLASPVAGALDEVARDYPPGTGDAPFLSNHDQVRIASQLGGDLEGLKLAAAILLTLEGTPFVYYGEEIGLLNGAGADDVCKRTPLPWDATAGHGFTTGTPWNAAMAGTSCHGFSPGNASVAAETDDPGSLLARYRDLIRVRAASPALRLGDMERLPVGAPGVLAYLRSSPEETVLVVHNLGKSASRATVTAPGNDALALLVDPGAEIAPGSGGDTFSVSLPPQATGIWRLLGEP